MDWNVVAQYLPLFEKAAWLTLRLGLAGIALAIVIGLVCALVQYYKVPVLRRVVGFYIQLSRNTPLLVQLFFIYYGLPKIGIRTDAAVCGIAGQLHGGGVPQRAGIHRADPDRERLQPRHGPDADDALRHPAAGHVHQRPGVRCQCHFPFKRNQRVQRYQPDGPDVHGEGPHRPVPRACSFLWSFTC